MRRISTVVKTSGFDNSTRQRMSFHAIKQEGLLAPLETHFQAKPGNSRRKNNVISSNSATLASTLIEF